MEQNSLMSSYQQNIYWFSAPQYHAMTQIRCISLATKLTYICVEGELINGVFICSRGNQTFIIINY
jgi:hypothetical protein